MKLSLFLILGFLTLISSLSSKDVEKKILLGSFLPHKSESDANTQDKLQSFLTSNFESRGFAVEQGGGAKEANIKIAQKNGSLYYIEGYYQRKKDKKILTVYALLYDPKTGNLVDVVRYSNDIADSLGESFKNIEDKYKEDEDKVIQNLAEAVSFSVLANPSKTEIRENIYDHLLSRPIGKEINVSVANEDKAQKAKEILKQFGDEEVITASRTSQKISDAPSKVYVFSRDTIHERGYRTLTELLQDVPGFDFNSFNDSGEYPTDLILRGISDVGQTQILLMENGIIQNDIGNGWLRHVQFDTVLIDVERIEIILGPGSALYGANAYAGLINIITRKGKSLFSKKDANLMGDARMQGGKNNTYMPEGLLAFKLPNDMIFQMAGRYYDTNGDRGKGRPDPGNYFNNNYEPDRVKTSEYGAINNDRTPFGTRKPITNGYNNSAQDYFLRGALSKDGLTFGFNIWDVKEGLSSYVPGYEYFANTPNIPFMKHHKGYFVNAAYETNITQKLHSTSKIYYRNTSIMPETGFEYTYQYQSIDFPVDKNGQRSQSTFDKAKHYYGPSSLTGAQQQFNYTATESNNLVFGFQLDKFTRQSISEANGGVSLWKSPDKSSSNVQYSYDSGNPSVATVFYSNTIAGYVQDEQKFFNDKLSFTLGIRHDQDTYYGKIWTKRAAIIGKPIEWYNVKFLYGEAFKAPTVFQLYDSFRGNLSLQPQKIRTYEVENSFFINKMATLKAGYFISLLDGQIAEGKNPDPNATAARSSIFQNYKPTHIYGFTFEGDIAITNEIKLFGNYTITRDRDVKTYLNVQANGLGSVTSISPVYDGREIDNIAERKGNLGINLLFFKKLNVNLRMNWVGRRKAPVTNRYFQPYDPNFLTKSYPYQTEGKPDGYMSGYTLLNATITYKDIWGIDGLELQVIGRNILNKAYMGMGRQSGNATRPVDSIQPSYVNSAGVGNPEGFVSPYHPQAGRELFLQVAYSF
jgi:outer membrane receptor protein involved in Fe transport